MSWTLFGIGAAAGLAWAWFVCDRLADRAYRYEDELDWKHREVRPLVIPLTMLLAGLLLGGAPGPGWVSALSLPVLAVCVPLSVVDLDVRRLPDRWLLPAIPTALGLALALAGVTGEWARLVRVAWMVPAALAVFFVLFLIGGGNGFGFGDVKLAALVTVPLAWLGGSQVLAGLMLPFLLGGLCALLLILLRLATRKTAIPFGPFMVLGALLVAAVPGLAR